MLIIEIIFFFEKSNMHGLLGTYTDYVNLRFSHIHDYLGSTIIRDSRVVILETHIWSKNENVQNNIFFKKIAFSKVHFSQKSNYFNYQIQVNWTKSVILPQCVICVNWTTSSLKSHWYALYASFSLAHLQYSNVAF